MRSRDYTFKKNGLLFNYSTMKEKIFLLGKQGRATDKNDCFTSSIMKANNCNKLITRNAKHFCQIKGIKDIPY